MQHPLTGGGMTIAFNGVLLISKLLSPANVPSLDDSSAVLKQIGRFHWARKQSSSLTNILAMVLYTLFTAGDSTLSALKSGCFRYFQISILSDWWEVQARTLRYAGGSCTVAFYSVRLVLAEAPVWMIPYKVGVAVLIIRNASWVFGPYLVWEA